QAAKALAYVASELRAMGCEVQLEKVMVSHWVRGEETAALVQFPGQAENTTQKIVLCALGASVATPPDGITAEVVVAKNFDELKALPRDKVAGKIVLFNYPFDKQMAAEGRGGEAYGEAVVYRGDGPSAAARQGAVACLIRSVGGAGHPIGINIKGKFEIKKLLALVLAVLQESGAGGTNFAEHIGADIEPMEKAGVPAFSPIQDSRFYFNYHHTAADTLDKI